MKRGLKRVEKGDGRVLFDAVADASPMKVGLKPPTTTHKRSYFLRCRRLPDEEGIETRRGTAWPALGRAVADVAPMKRGPKLIVEIQLLPAPGRLQTFPRLRGD